MLSLKDDSYIRKIAEVALPGEQIRGSAGVVVVGSTYTEYKLLEEIESEEFRDHLEDLLTDNGRSHVVVVEEGVDDATSRFVGHVWMVLRSELMRVSSQ